MRDSTLFLEANCSSGCWLRLPGLRVAWSSLEWARPAAEIDLCCIRANILAFNVESEAELTLLAARARKLKRRARFALRVNPDVFADTHPYISTGLREHKFTASIFARHSASTRAWWATEWLEAHGVSVHIGSQIRSAEPFWGGYGARVVKLVLQLQRNKASKCWKSIDAEGGLVY